MTSAHLGLAALLAAASATGAVAPAPTPSPATGASARAPYDAPPVPGVAITITLDLSAASGLLDVLSAPGFDADAAKALEALPAVAAAIRDSKRPADVFEHDLAAAFDEKSRITVFDFRRVREDRQRWRALLALIASREAELTRRASDRARALMPADRPVAVTQAILLTFGLPGRADHIAVPEAAGANWTIVADLARELSDETSSAPADQVTHISRLMAAQAYQRAWAEYRAGSPAWQKRDPSMGQLEPLLKRVAEAGPVAIYNVDENFFPLSVWLKRAMRDDIDELNRVADRLVASGGELDARMAMAAEIQKPEFISSVAAPAGTFLSDGILQVLGLEAYRAALAGGPRAFFEAYERASQGKGSGLVPLGKAIRAQLAAAAAPPKG